MKHHITPRSCSQPLIKVLRKPKGNAHLPPRVDCEANILYENTEQFNNSSDNSRVVCLLLSIIIVCLILSIGSLITAVFAMTSFEHYKGKVTLSTRIVNECSVNMAPNSTSGTVSKKCGHKKLTESKVCMQSVMLQ